MNRSSPEQLEQEWKGILSVTQPQLMQHAMMLIEQHKQDMATHFYQHMLDHPVASQFLSHDQVKTRLHASMQRWMVSIFAVRPEEDLRPAIDLQVKIGVVHARIDLPVHMVLRGARALKDRFYQLLEADSAINSSVRSALSQFVFTVIDLAMEIMSQAYGRSHDRNARAEESYRLFSVAQNIATERERQRAALLDWENEMMFQHAIGQRAEQLPRLGSSEFGLWFGHKGAHAFQGAPETIQILDGIEEIDKVLLPAFDIEVEARRDADVKRLRDLRESARVIGFHLDGLFEQHNELEAGRDVLTRLLSRKFLPVVLNKEINYSRHSDTHFALLAIDIDHFKQINDSHGHEAGDAVLQQLAVLFNNSSRGGDYVFRLGGEEFLILLVDVDAEGALRAAQTLRKKIESEVFRLPRDHTIGLTVSMGLALYNGHPDYQQVLRRADAALFQAKNGGRNRVVVAAD